MKHSCWSVLLMVAVFGCGGSDLPELGAVTGVVTLDGEPLTDALINFTPTGSGRPSTGQTDDQGRYTLQYLPDVEGAIVGDHLVTVEMIMTVEMDDLPDDPSELTPEQLEMKQRAERTIDTSLQKSVKSGSNEINIDL